MSAPNEPDPMTDAPLCTGDPLARALSHLEPMPAPMSRDQLMFAAGAAGRDRDVAFWKRIVYGQATAACLVVGVGIALSGIPNNGAAGRSFSPDVARNQAAPPAPEKAPVASEPPPPAPGPRDESGDATKMAKYLQLRSDVLAGGISVLPNPNAPAPNVDVGTLEDSLQLPRGSFAIHGAPAKPKPPAEDDQ